MPRAPPQGNKRPPPVPAAAMEQESKRSRGSPPLLWDPVAIPMPLASVLQRWGPELRREMEVAVRKEPGLAAPCVSAGACSLRVATDCSGLEAPLLALKAMQVPFRHVFSSEIDPQKRDFINMNFPGAVLYDDMARRDQSLAPPHDLYVCGFPCKPFSSLHHGSQFFKEAQARPFFAAIKTIAACLPAVAILENVPGIQRVMPQVLRHLRKLAWYTVIVIHDNPLSMGEPVDRPRIFFVLLRADVVKDNAQRLATQLVSAGCCETPRAAVRDRCLPNDSPAVSCGRNAGTVALAPPQRKPSSSAPLKWKKTSRAAISPESAGLVPVDISRGILAKSFVGQVWVVRLTTGLQRRLVTRAGESTCESTLPHDNTGREGPCRWAPPCSGALGQMFASPRARASSPVAPELKRAEDRRPRGEHHALDVGGPLSPALLRAWLCLHLCSFFAHTSQHVTHRWV